MKKLVIVFMLFALPLYGQNTLIIPDVELPMHAEMQSVIVSGSGRTMEEAIRNALTVAVERVAGTLLTSETYVKNGELIYEQISRVPMSYVLSYETLTYKGQSSDGYRVSIEAQVAKRKLADKLNSLNMAVLEVADSAEAHSQLLASISDYSNKIENIRRAFRRNFGDINSLFSINIRDVHFYTADVKDGLLPVSIIFNVAIDWQKYEARRAAIAKVLVEDIGAVETKAVAQYTFLNRDTPFNEFNYMAIPSEQAQDYRLMLMRKQGSGYVFDAYDMRDLSEDMRKFAYIDGIDGRELIDGLWDDFVHVTFKDDAGAVIFEDFVIMMTKEFGLRGAQDIPQTGLSIVWESETPMYDRTFELNEHGKDLQAMLHCAMIYEENGGYCVLFERGEHLPAYDSKLIMPFFNFRLEAEGNFIYSRLFTNNLTFEYTANIPQEQAMRIRDIFVETVDIPQGAVR
ncbi:MAG: hypothetical protein LBV04_06435 [Deferribacteraceae bacterium]|jgi:hypothetical protein|nr:hypothetical protein [Deferribacteraceae bacterium]